MRASCYRNELVDAIETFLPPEVRFGAGRRRRRSWGLQRLAWMWLLMCWSGERTLTDRFQQGRHRLGKLKPRWSLPRTYTGFSKALRAAQVVPLAGLRKRLQQRLKRVAQDHWYRQGWCAFAVDGSRFECPRTGANERRLGCAGRDKTSPQLYATILWHMGTGAAWDYRLGSGTASERQQFQEMIPDLPPAALVVADAGFPGYELCCQLAQSGHFFLLRVGNPVTLLQELGAYRWQGRSTVYLWPQRRRNQPPLVLRLIVRRKRGQKLYLITNVLCHRALTDRQAEVFYQMRWGVEVFYRSTKQTLQRRRMLSAAPAQALLELHGTILGVWALNLLNVEALVQQHQDPLRASVAAALRQVRCVLEERVITTLRPASLCRLLARAVRDNHVRRACKWARHWPHKKTETPPRTPQIRRAPRALRQAAKKFDAICSAA